MLVVKDYIKITSEHCCSEYFFNSRQWHCACSPLLGGSYAKVLPLTSVGQNKVAPNINVCTGTACNKI